MLVFSNTIINSRYINTIYNDGTPSHYNLSAKLKGTNRAVSLSNMYHYHANLTMISNRSELIIRESARSVSFSKLNSNSWFSKLRNLPFNLMSEYD